MSPAPLRASALGFSLALQVSHAVAARSLPAPPPACVDVLSAADITFAVRAVPPVLPHALLRSALVQYVQAFLAMNSEQLGLGHISPPYVDGDGILKFTVSSAYSLLHSNQSPLPTAILTGLGLTFSCSSSTSLFSPQLLLPIQSTLKVVLAKFLSRDLVRPYPLIFGPWRISFDAEMALLPHVCRSVLDIIHRSRNTSFRRKCLRLIKAVEANQRAAFADSLTEFESFLGHPLTCHIEHAMPEDEAFLLMRMQCLYRSLVRPHPFKVSVVDISSEEGPFDFPSFSAPEIPQAENIKDFFELAHVDLSSCHQRLSTKQNIGFDTEDLCAKLQIADDICVWSSDEEFVPMSFLASRTLGQLFTCQDAKDGLGFIHASDELDIETLVEPQIPGTSEPWCMHERDGDEEFLDFSDC